MGHGDTDTGLEKLKETLKDLVYSNKLIQVLIDPPPPPPPFNVNWKWLYLLPDELKDINPSATELLSLCRYAFTCFIVPAILDRSALTGSSDGGS